MIPKQWSVENKTQWVLQVTFNDEKFRVRALNSPRNLVMFRRMALNQETTFERGLRQKRKRAAMSDEYMMLILKPLCQA